MRLKLVLVAILMFIVGSVSGFLNGRQKGYQAGYEEGLEDGELNVIVKEIEKLEPAGEPIDFITKSLENADLSPEPTAKPTPNLIANTQNQTGLKSLGKFTITAYCPCKKCCGKSDGITASGTKATAGRTIAADISKYPFGTKLYIEGHEYIVEDKGGSIKKNKIDIFFNTHQEALQYGKRQVEVFVKE